MQPTEELVGEEWDRDWIIAGEEERGGGRTDAFKLAESRNGFSRVRVVSHEGESSGGRFPDFFDGIGGYKLSKTGAVGAELAVPRTK